jgi:hypothetical protein
LIQRHAAPIGNAGNQIWIWKCSTYNAELERRILALLEFFLALPPLW